MLGRSRVVCPWSRVYFVTDCLSFCFAGQVGLYALKIQAVVCDNTLTVLPFELDCMLACGNCGFFCCSFRIVLVIFSIFFLFPLRWLYTVALHMFTWELCWSTGLGQGSGGASLESCSAQEGWMRAGWNLPCTVWGRCHDPWPGSHATELWAPQLRFLRKSCESCEKFCSKAMQDKKARIAFLRQ